MFKSFGETIILKDVFREKFNYKYSTYEDLLKQNFISFEGNGYSAKFWIRDFNGDEFLYKETDECHVLGELLTFKIANMLGVPCAECKACYFEDRTGLGILSKKVYEEGETLVLGAQIIQEFLNNYPRNNGNVLELLRNPEFRELYGIPDKLMTLDSKNLFRYVINNLNNLEELWAIFENYFDNSKDVYLMINSLIEIFFLDVFLMQDDRHIENWGLIKSYPSGLYRPAPLLDNAAVFGIDRNGFERVQKIEQNKHLLDKENTHKEFKKIFYSEKLLLTSSDDDIINARARKRKGNIEILRNFLKISDSRYTEIFLFFKEMLEQCDIRTLIIEIEQENGIVFSETLKEFIIFSFNQNLYYINEMLKEIGRGR